MCHHFIFQICNSGNSLPSMISKIIYNYNLLKQIHTVNLQQLQSLVQQNVQKFADVVQYNLILPNIGSSQT